MHVIEVGRVQTSLPSKVLMSPPLLVTGSCRQASGQIRLKNKKDCADLYCVTLIELQAHCDAFIQNICKWTF